MRPADIVVVVWKMEKLMADDVLLSTEHPVELFQLRITLGHHISGPVIRCRHTLRLGCEQSCQFHIAGTNAKQRAILTRTPALHIR